MILEISSDQLSRLRAQGGNDLSDVLERGNIVHFPHCPVELPSLEDLHFLRQELTLRLRRKNVSFYPARERLVGLKAERALIERTRQILKTHAERVRTLLERVMPGFMTGALHGTTSMRPLQEKGRNLSAHASNELVHVDAGAYGATRGDRILRFFVNVNPTEERVWSSRGTFAELYPRYGRAAGIVPERPQPKLLKPNALERAFFGMLSATRITALRMVDTSPYDRLMRRFHNYMKDAPEFRDATDGLQIFSFKPFAAWMVLTDAVSHACLSGQHALVDTYVVPLSNCRLRELSPYDILASAGQNLAPVEKQTTVQA